MHHINVALRGKLNRSMHRKDRYPAIDYRHTHCRNFARDGACTSLINLTVFACLPCDVVFVENACYFAHKLCRSIVTAGFAARAGIFDDSDTAVYICRIARLVCIGIAGIKSTADIRGKANGIFDAAHVIRTRLVTQFAKEELNAAACHTGYTDASDFFFICEHNYTCLVTVIRIKQCGKSRIRTDSVILTVSGNHTSVKADIA